jgi:hypothetical protein
VRLPKRRAAGLAVAVAGVALGPAGAAVAPSLSGETLTASAFLGVGVFDVDVDCRPESTSTIDFHAEGVAAGPYPGTFVEDGRATQERVGLGRPGFTGGRLLSFVAGFTIFGADGSLVVGDKELDPATSEAFTGLGSEGNCIGDQDRHLADIRATAFYTATVQRPDGTTYRDHGTTRVNAQSNTQGFVPDTYSFEETFVSLGILPPLATPGKVTGGGQAPSAGGGSLTFAVVARSDAAGTDGGCNVVEHETGTHVKCLTVEQFAQTGPHAIFSGLAEVDGVRTTYRIDVADLCESGAGCDTFAIETDSGFVGGGVLTAGNVQAHG